MAIYCFYLAVAGLSMLMALVATPVVNWVGIRCGRVDNPALRKVHSQPMVRLGGVAIFGATVLGAVGAAALQWVYPFEEVFVVNRPVMVLLLAGGTGFFTVGMADDLFELGAFHRLWMQLGIAAIIWWGGVRIDSLLLPSAELIELDHWLSLLITVLWLAGVVNAINWIDGLDGLAAGVASVATGCVVVISGGFSGLALQPMIGMVGAALLGSLLGFLCYNSHPAKIFMGDGGSYFVGFVLASLCIVQSQQIQAQQVLSRQIEQNAATVSPMTVLPITVLPLIVLMLPLVDMVSVIVARLYHQKSPFEADNRHLHHRLLAMGFSHRDAVSLEYGLALASGCLALAMITTVGSWRWVVAMGAILLAIGGIIARRLWQRREEQAINTITGNEIW